MDYFNLGETRIFQVSIKYITYCAILRTIYIHYSDILMGHLYFDFFYLLEVIILCLYLL